MGLLSNLAPLLILLTIVSIAAFVGYQFYLWSQQMGDRGREYMEKKNMSFTPDGGLKVGVKEVKDEAYADKTQSVLVNVWNNASFPNYKSRLGWNSAAGSNGAQSAKSSNGRPGVVKAPSSSGSSSARSVPTQQRAPVQRSREHVPGGFD